MIGKASGVGVMLFDPKLGFVIEQPIEYIGRIASGRVDRGDVIATVLIGDMRVEKHACRRGRQVHCRSARSHARSPPHGRRRETVGRRTTTWFLRPRPRRAPAS